MVHEFLIKNNIRNKSILELNCGTGEDAIWLESHQNKVIATDISSEMLNLAKQKNDGSENIKYTLLDINSIDKNRELKDLKFDVIFSNFGGFNCLSPTQLNSFFESAGKKLNKNGKIICVIMPKNCIWENKYLFFTGKWKQLFRRNTKNSLNVNVDGKQVKTWFYNPNTIKKSVENKYEIKTYKPVGFYIPPSYLEPFFKNKVWLLNILNLFENRIKNWSFLARYSDHFIISMQLK
jgi:ubiquinone/menaquinone biosynthesis C-methylase UbiE